MPRRTVLALLLSAACLLGGPAAAQAAAGPVDPQGADVQAALAIAAQHWGSRPCGGSELVAWVPDANAQLNAMASWSNPLDAWLQPLLNTDCVVSLNPNASWDWPKLCTVITHETGHLLGHPHSADPNDLMAPVYVRPIPECAGTPEPEGTLTAANAAAQRAAVAAQQAAEQAAVAAAIAEDPAPAAPAPASSTRAIDDDDASATATAAVRSGANAATAVPTSSTVKASRAVALSRCLRKASRKRGAARTSARAACRRAATRAKVRAAA